MQRAGDPGEFPMTRASCLLPTWSGLDGDLDEPRDLAGLDPTRPCSNTRWCALDASAQHVERAPQLSVQRRLHGLCVHPVFASEFTTASLALRHRFERSPVPLFAEASVGAQPFEQGVVVSGDLHRDDVPASNQQSMRSLVVLDADFALKTGVDKVRDDRVESEHSLEIAQTRDSPKFSTWHGAVV